MQRHPEVDVVMVGTGWTASILAQQLTAAGLTVVSLERGRAQWTWPDFAHNHDQLKYSARDAMMQDLSRETLTWRPNPDAPTLPFREHSTHMVGEDLGGSGVHWSALSWRYLPMDFRYRSHHVDRYGEDKIPAGVTLQDWPVSYDELEPYYDRFEYDVGVSGIAGNLGGRILAGGNPFEGPRSRPYPLPPLAPMPHGEIFADACRRLGYHPFRNPAAILSQGYTDVSGHPRAGCLYCGYCTNFGCEVDAKSSPLTTYLPMAFDTGRYEVRTHATVVGIELDDRGMATGLRYMDREGREHLQPAARVFLTGWAFTNARLLLLSRNRAHPDGVGNNRGLVGRHYTHQMNETAVTGVFEGRRFNRYMGNNATRQAIADFYGDLFDHSTLDFIGGAWLESGGGEMEPISALGQLPMLEDRQWGQAYKDNLATAFNSTIGLSVRPEALPHESRYLDLDPTYTDAYGLPLLRVTYDWIDNDRALYRFMADRLDEIMAAMNPTDTYVTRELEAWSISSGDNHPTGGAIMGTDPSDSVTNKYGQVWDAPNVFVTGSSLFPHTPAFNPTETAGALAYFTADAIRGHLDRPEGLMT